MVNINMKGSMNLLGVEISNLGDNNKPGIFMSYLV